MSCVAWLLLVVLANLLAGQASTTNRSTLDLLLVVGAPGEKEYSEIFTDEARDWASACRSANKSFQVLEPVIGESNQLDRLTALLTNQPASDTELWIVLIGHGTFDGKDARFNLAGPDLTGTQCATLLSSVQRPIIFIDTSSASAPFINQLSHSNRVVITATKSGFEENYARFGQFLTKAISDLTADLDKDGQVSLLEAFLMASRQVADFYKSERRLATEHALLDDNGDGKGTPATFYRGVRPAKKAEGTTVVDGFRAHQVYFIPNEAEAKLSPELRKKRNDLELQLEQLRVRKADLPEEAYLKQIEPLLLELAKLYRDADASATQAAASSKISAKPAVGSPGE